MRLILKGAVLLVLMPAGATVAEAKPVRGFARVGQCATSRMKWIGERLGERSVAEPSSGSAFLLVNGVYGVSYDRVPAVDRSRVGDRVRVCLASIPRHCPRGDDRGRMYKVVNLRTRQSWVLPDAEHQCGGA